MEKGIDISVHNGNIRFDEIKDKVSFVMIRSSWGFFQEDNLLDKNVKGCEQEKIPYGFYHYSYAVNLEEAKKEVEGVLNLIQHYHPTYPIVIDMEDADGWKERNGNPSNETYIEICEYFCDQIEKAGYYAMIYASYDWWVNRLNDKRLERFDKWLADWRGLKNPSIPCGIWQYSSKEQITGINGNVDVNISYKNYPEIIQKLNQKSPIIVKEDGTSPNII